MVPESSSVPGLKDTWLERKTSGRSSGPEQREKTVPVATEAIKTVDVQKKALLPAVLDRGVAERETDLTKVCCKYGAQRRCSYNGERHVCEDHASICVLEQASAWTFGETKDGGFAISLAESSTNVVPKLYVGPGFSNRVWSSYGTGGLVATEHETPRKSADSIAKETSQRNLQDTRLQKAIIKADLANERNKKQQSELSAKSAEAKNLRDVETEKSDKVNTAKEKLAEAKLSRMKYVKGREGAAERDQKDEERRFEQNVKHANNELKSATDDRHTQQQKLENQLLKARMDVESNRKIAKESREKQIKDLDKQATAKTQEKKKREEVSLLQQQQSSSTTRDRPDRSWKVKGGENQDWIGGDKHSLGRWKFSDISHGGTFKGFAVSMGKWRIQEVNNRDEVGQTDLVIFNTKFGMHTTPALRLSGSGREPESAGKTLQEDRTDVRWSNGIFGSDDASRQPWLVCATDCKKEPTCSAENKNCDGGHGACLLANKHTAGCMASDKSKHEDIGSWTPFVIRVSDKWAFGETTHGHFAFMYRRNNAVWEPIVFIKRSGWMGGPKARQMVLQASSSGKPSLRAGLIVAAAPHAEWLHWNPVCRRNSISLRNVCSVEPRESQSMKCNPRGVDIAKAKRNLNQCKCGECALGWSGDSCDVWWKTDKVEQCRNKRICLNGGKMDYETAHGCFCRCGPRFETSSAAVQTCKRGGVCRGCDQFKCFAGYKLGKSYKYEFKSGLIARSQTNHGSKDGTESAGKDQDWAASGLAIITNVGRSYAESALYFRLVIHRPRVCPKDKKFQKRANDGHAESVNANCQQNEHRLEKALANAFYYKQNCNFAIEHSFHPGHENPQIINFKKAIIRLFNNKISVQQNCKAAMAKGGSVSTLTQRVLPSEDVPGREHHSVHQLNTEAGLLQVSTRVRTRNGDFTTEEKQDPHSADKDKEQGFDFKRAKDKFDQYMCDRECQCMLTKSTEKQQAGYGMDVDGERALLDGAVPEWLTLTSSDMMMKQTASLCDVRGLKGSVPVPLEAFPTEGAVEGAATWASWKAKDNLHGGADEVSLVFHSVKLGHYGFAMIYVVSSIPREIMLTIQSTGPAKVWLDTKKLLTHQQCDGKTGSVALSSLRQGLNRLLVQVGAVSDSPSLLLHVTDREGRRIATGLDFLRQPQGPQFGDVRNGVYCDTRNGGDWMLVRRAQGGSDRCWGPFTDHLMGKGGVGTLQKDGNYTPPPRDPRSIL